MLRYTSSVEPEDLPVAFFVYQEPENDPKNFAYFWVCRDDHISEQKWVGCSEGGCCWVWRVVNMIGDVDGWYGGHCWAWHVVNMDGDVDGWCGAGGGDKLQSLLWLIMLIVIDDVHCYDDVEGGGLCSLWLVRVGTSVRLYSVCVLHMVSYAWTGVDVDIVC